MARLIPTIKPEEIKNKGERDLAIALVKQLGKDVQIFHSFDWIRHKQPQNGKKEYLEEGEADFVIIDPDKGILFVEVKGGMVRYETVGDVWIRRHEEKPEERLSKSPFSQAQDSMHALMEIIKKDPCFKAGGVKFTFGYAVAFPHCNWRGDLPPNTTPDLVWDSKKCEDIAQAVENTFNRWRRDYPARMSNSEIEGIHKALYPQFGILPVLWRKVEDQEEKLRRLTIQQQALLNFLGGRTKAAIEGVAGSGKTILALSKAQQCAEKNMKTLMVCYNTELRDWLEQALPEKYRSNLEVKTFHGLATEFCSKAQISFAPNQNRADGRNFWRDVAPEKLMEACSLISADKKFDAVIVDEGQDFHDLWWTALDGVFKNEKEKGCYFVFYDPDQNIFVPNPSIPELGEPFHLPHNCRNTKRIAEHCLGLVKRPIEVPDGAPVGDAPEMLVAANMQKAFELAGKKVREWCLPTVGMRRNQVAVLAHGGTKSDWPADFGKNTPATKSFKTWREDKGVLIASFFRFKGLEADAVIVIDNSSTPTVPDPEEFDGQSVDRYTNLQYVARSRAKHMLTIIKVG